MDPDPLPAPAQPISTRFRVLRWVYAFGVGIVILSGYLLAARMNAARFARGVEPISLWTALDQAIPVMPAAFWTYISYYLVAISPTFLATRWRHMIEMGAAYGITSVLGWIGWVLIPVRMMAPPIACSGLTCELLKRFVEADGGVNVFPSLHVAHSVLAALFFRAHRSTWSPLVTAGAIAVTASTVLTRQHYVADLPAGLVIALIGWWAAGRILGPIGQAESPLQPA